LRKRFTLIVDSLFATGYEENGSSMNVKELLHLSMRDMLPKRRVQVVGAYKYLHNISVSKINVAGSE
jgi:hypothetical protein